MVERSKPPSLFASLESEQHRHEKTVPASESPALASDGSVWTAVDGGASESDIPVGGSVELSADHSTPSLARADLIFQLHVHFTRV